ncbi:MAG: phage tail tip lysozyme [Candidatus Saccharimonadales bacterium]
MNKNIKKFIRQSSLVISAFLFAILQVPLVSALGFADPPPLTNREKAHRNIIFTGGGGSGGSSSGSTCTPTTNLTISKDFSLGTDEKDRRVNLVKAFMAQYGLTVAQAAGPVGNFMLESGGLHIPPDINQNEKTGAPPNNSELGYGWAQWSGGRKTTFVNFMKDNQYVTDKGHATDAANFAYLAKELESDSYASTIIELKKQQSPEDAAVSFEATFEKAGAPVLEKRKQYARQAFTEYNNASGSGSNATGCGGTMSSVDYGEVAFPLEGSKKVVSNPGIFKNNDTALGEHPYTAYDIMSPGGTPIRAFISGKVSDMFNDTCGGDSVKIWNEELKIGISYMHMNTGGVIPKMGQQVAVGEVIGAVGKWNGGCGGDHLHIDASLGQIRGECSRGGCSIQDEFRPMGKELYQTYNALPNN